MTTDDSPAAVSVLVIDDERGLADLYAAWLPDEYDVRTAYDGRAGLDALDEGVEVVFLDRRMPGLSGDDVLAEIHDRGYDPSVAMLTAVEPDFDIVDMAFDHYLVKPVSQCDLVRTVERFLEWNEYDERLQELFALFEKRDVLEDQKSAGELDESPEYRRLAEAIERQKRATDDIVDDWDSDDFQSLLRAGAFR